MAISLCVENQVHKREYTGTGPSGSLQRVLAAACPGSQLSHVSEYGDTMFNIPQMNTLLIELEEIRTVREDLSEDVAVIKSVIEQAIRRRGYLWVSGD